VFESVDTENTRKDCVIQTAGMVTVTEFVVVAIVAVPVCFRKSSAANNDEFAAAITTAKSSVLENVLFNETIREK
jgi:hypothetical protein